MYRKRQLPRKMNIAAVQTAFLFTALLVVTGQAETAPTNKVAAPSSEARGGEALLPKLGSPPVVDERDTTSKGLVLPELSPKKDPRSDKDLTKKTVRYSGAVSVYRDPITGKFTPPPASAPSIIIQLPNELQNALSTSSEGLVMESSLGGGTMVRLQGRFQNAIVASIDEDGHFSTQCRSSLREEGHAHHDSHITSNMEKE